MEREDRECDNLEDMWKRKRKELERSREGKEIFRNSRKTERYSNKEKNL